VRGVLSRGINRLRAAAFEANGEDGYIITDGFDASSVGGGTTSDDALAAWLRAISNRAPFLPPAPLGARATSPRGQWEKVELDSGIGRRIRDGGWHDSSLTGPRASWDTPAVRISLPSLPLRGVPSAFADAGFSRWVRVVGAFGHVHAALYRADRAGFTLVGEGVVDVVDPAALERQIAEANSGRPLAAEKNHPKHRAVLGYYKCFDDMRRKPQACTLEARKFVTKLSPAAIDGDRAHGASCKDWRSGSSSTSRSTFGSGTTRTAEACPPGHRRRPYRLQLPSQSFWCF
jgi:hypothetical protein